ncbi:MAG: tetratricopeptide repeat protein [Stenomitos frigidus ULC029]
MYPRHQRCGKKVRSPDLSGSDRETLIPHNLPYSGVTKFVGRDDELKALHEQLQAGKTIAISAISGMGGIGKTELALQYAYKHLELQTYPGSVCWLKARQEIGTQIVSFAQTQLELVLSDDLELLEKVAVCWRQWRDGDVLVVFDDVQSYAEIQPFLPPARACFKVLLTTRLTLQSPVQNFELKKLSEEKALELLRAIVPDGRIDENLATAKRLCEWLGYLPLGLELVGRYLARKTDTSLATLWQRLQDKKLDAKALKEAAPEMTAELGVAAAFELSWQELDKPAQTLATLLSLFALAEIPWTLVEACFAEEYVETLEDLRDDSLLNLHLLERTGSRMYQLHQLLREFFAAKREQMADTDKMKQILCRVVVAVGQQISPTPTLTIIEHVTPAIPHLKEVATTLAPWLTDENLITPATHLAWFYEGQSAYIDAEQWKQHCLTQAKTRFATDHPDIATSLNNLAELYRMQGRYAEAEPLYTHARDISERQLSSDHPLVAISLNNLANLYRAQGRYAEAGPLYIRALDIYERQSRVDHPLLGTCLAELAALYTAQGRYAEAEPLYIRALDIYERQLGTDHLHVAIASSELAGLYFLQERYAEAKLLCTRALDIYKLQLGTDHPFVANSLEKLANLYASQGLCTEAEPLYIHVLDIRERLLRADHPDLAASLNNLANLYRAQERYSETEPLYLRALAITFQKFGDDHPNTRTGRRNFLGFLQAVVQAGQTGELSDHPTTQDLLRQMQTGDANA